MQNLSWKANRFAASQANPLSLWNPNVHYRTHKHLPPVSILGQSNPVHILTFHLVQIHPNIFHPSTPKSTLWSLFLLSPHQDPIRPLSSPTRAHVQTISFFSILSPAQNWVRSTDHLAPRYIISIPPLPLLLRPNIPLNTIFPHTLSFLSFLNISEQVTNPYKTTGKILVLYIY